MNYYHLKYNIDKQKFRNIFYNNYGKGNWGEKDWVGKVWWKIYDIDNEIQSVREDLNIVGLDDKPRFAHLKSNTLIPDHVDEDYMCSIIINLMDEQPVINIEEKNIPYESLLFHNGYLIHRVDPVPYERLMLKFCLRHPWEQIVERMSHVIN